jgi:hypothetical protein
MSWPTFGEHVAKLTAALAEHPDGAHLPVVSTDDQCAHSEPRGPHLQELARWPTEYCLDEYLPEGTTQFVQV